MRSLGSPSRPFPDFLQGSSSVKYLTQRYGDTRVGVDPLIYFPIMSKHFFNTRILSSLQTTTTRGRNRSIIYLLVDFFLEIDSRTFWNIKRKLSRSHSFCSLKLFGCPGWIKLKPLWDSLTLALCCSWSRCYAIKLSFVWRTSTETCSTAVCARSSAFKM